MAEKDKVIQGYQAPAYQESDAVKNAQQQLQQQIANKPGDYQSQWQGQLDSLFQQIQNKKPFQYDINTDALYQQAAQQYIQQGQKAMMDTMGQAAALTGGYGNSYAQSVGQQTYQGYLQGLYEQMPQYAQLALDRYNQEGQDMLDLYAMMGQNEDRDYNRYMDMLSAYQAELNRLQGIYDSEREFDYGKYADDRDFGYSQYINDRDYAFQLEQAEEAKRQWQAEFDEAKRQYDQNYALSVSKSSGSSGGGGGGSGYGYDTHGMSTSEIKALQRELGITADGIWGPKTEAAYQAKYGIDIEAEYLAMKKAGAPYKETDKYLLAAIDAGLISKNEANDLRHKRY